MSINPINYNIHNVMSESFKLNDSDVLRIEPGIHPDELLKISSNHKNLNIIIYSPTECLYYCYDEIVFDDSYRNKLNNILRENNVNIHSILCGHDLEIYDVFNTEECSNIHIHYWPTAILFESFNMSWGWRTETKQCNIDGWFNELSELTLTPNISKLYKHYNHRPRTHRAIMMDNLYKNNLLKVGYNSWNNFITPNNQLDWNINIVPQYSFKYWKEELLQIDDFTCKDFSYPRIFTDDAFNLNTLFILVGESSAIVPYVTEKTYRCLLLGHPFLIYGSKNHNKELLKLGFELYDELFDYSFEELDLLDDRINGVIDIIENLKDKDYNELYKRVEPKVLRNKKRALELIKNDEFIPQFIIDYYNKVVKLK